MSTNEENFEDCNNAAENERDNFSTEQTNSQTWDEITIKIEDDEAEYHNNENYDSRPLGDWFE